MKKIIYYYQTFCGLDDILNKSTCVTHIHVSSIHFGINNNNNNNNNNKYIHLNDNDPYDNIYDSLWYQLKLAQDLNIKLILMVGGAGGAYNTLFSDFDVYYDKLKQLIIEKNIDGIDLDIEEFTTLENVIMLINKIKIDFGSQFIISMAPVQNSLEYDSPGMGGFIYKDLYKKIGDKIDYFNVQSYYDYSLNSYEKIINNDYPINKIIMGSISNQDFSTIIMELKKINNKYPNFAGAYNWEYYNSPPNKLNPGLWSYYINDTINK